MIHKKKGATLAEICVVLAVVSIISLMVVSFVSMTSGRSSTSATKLNVMEELDLVETLVDNWLTTVIEECRQTADNSLTISDDAQNVRIQGSLDAHVYMENLSELKILLPGQETDAIYLLKTVKGLKFACVTQENTGDALYFCTVEYAYRTSNNEVTQYYTFCVNPRVGEVITLPEA